MSLHAQIIDGKVARTVDLDPAIRAAWVEAGNPKADAFLPVVDTPIPAYDPATQAIEPAWTIFPGTNVVRDWTIRPLTPDELRKTWTSYEFLTRFTDVERKRIWNRAKNDDDIADFLMMSQSANEVLSDDPMTLAGMNLLVSKNILTQARRDEILG